MKTLIKKTLSKIGELVDFIKFRIEIEQVFFEDPRYDILIFCAFTLFWVVVFISGINHLIDKL